MASAAADVTTLGLGTLAEPAAEAISESAGTLIADEAGSLSAVEPGITVLGHYPQYVELAQSLGANHFNLAPEVWEAMSPADRWAANRAVLDAAAARGDEIRLATPLREGPSIFRDELEYMSDTYGYEVSPDGTRLIR